MEDEHHRQAAYRSNSPIVGYCGHIPGEKWIVGESSYRSRSRQCSALSDSFGSIGIGAASSSETRPINLYSNEATRATFISDGSKDFLCSSMVAENKGNILVQQKFSADRGNDKKFEENFHRKAALPLGITSEKWSSGTSPSEEISSFAPEDEDGESLPAQAEAAIDTNKLRTQAEQRSGSSRMMAADEFSASQQLANQLWHSMYVKNENNTAASPVKVGEKAIPGMSNGEFVQSGPLPGAKSNGQVIELMQKSLVEGGRLTNARAPLIRARSASRISSSQCTTGPTSSSKKSSTSKEAGGSSNSSTQSEAIKRKNGVYQPKGDVDQNTPLTPMVGLKSNLNLEQQQHQQTDGQRTRTITPSSISVADRHSGSSSSGTRERKKKSTSCTNKVVNTTRTEGANVQTAENQQRTDGDAVDDNGKLFDDVRAGFWSEGQALKNLRNHARLLRDGSVISSQDIFAAEKSIRSEVARLQDTADEFATPNSIGITADQPPSSHMLLSKPEDSMMFSTSERLSMVSGPVTNEQVGDVDENDLPVPGYAGHLTGMFETSIGRSFTEAAKHAKRLQKMYHDKIVQSRNENVTGSSTEDVSRGHSA